MSSRNRGRASANQDADEERRLWKEIREKAKDVDTMVARSNDIGREIVEYEKQQAALREADKSLSGDLDEKLEKLYRENLKLAEDVQHIIEGKSHDTHLLDSIKILAAMREASEEVAATVASSQHSAGQSGGGRAPNGKLKRAGTKGSGGGKNGSASAATAHTSVTASLEEGEVDSAAPSPKISLSANSSRLPTKDKSSRAGSIPATRETSVKIEDGAESVASSADGATSTTTGKVSSVAGARSTNRLVLREGEVVFCRHDAKSYDVKKSEVQEGEGILCRVTSVIGEGKQRRYEVQDADPTGETSPPSRASVSQLIQIPQTNKGLSDLAHKRKVLAEYPDTTTFYPAEVAEEWLARKAHVGERGQYVKLNFQDDETVREVERRFVLTEK